MFCSNCGKELPEDVKFCKNCGTPVEASEEQISAEKPAKTEDKLSASAETPEKKSEKETAFEETKTGKESTFWKKIDGIGGFIGASVIFAWNSYVIFHNFSVHDGYFWAILGIIVNLGILIAYTHSDFLKKKFPKFGKYLTYIEYGYYAVLLLIFGVILGHVPWKNVLAENATPLVSQILKNIYGDYSAKCKYVDDVFKVTTNIYRGTAYLDNGNTIGITISDAEEGHIYVELDSW
ncbi:MAG: zinc-ribbon domain-containing protein [Spirochaetaceae bacterium]|nr:zinc-ribbon domain-containing protein [Spirochaetaceae bacterium]